MRRFARKLLRDLLQDESGPTAVEYAVMLSLIIAVALAAIQSVGTQAASSFNQSQSELSTYLDAVYGGN